MNFFENFSFSKSIRNFVHMVPEVRQGRFRPNRPSCRVHYLVIRCHMQIFPKFFYFFESTQMWFGIIPEVLRGRFRPNRRSCRDAILGDNMQIFSKILFFRIRLKSGLALSRKCSEAVFGRIGYPAGVQYWVIICKFFRKFYFFPISSKVVWHCSAGAA